MGLLLYEIQEQNITYSKIMMFDVIEVKRIPNTFCLEINVTCLINEFHSTRGNE